MKINIDVLKEKSEIDLSGRELKANKLIEENKVKIEKYEITNENTYNLKATVEGEYEKYLVEVRVSDSKITKKVCTCEDNKKSLNTCKHIIASTKELEKEKYKISKKDKRYILFEQLLSSFYKDTKSNIQSDIKNINLVLEPKLVQTSVYNQKLKLELKIGDTQLHKIKDLTQFCEAFETGRIIKYGNKLDVNHKEESFSEKSLKLLKFVLKYSEILKNINNEENNSTYSNFDNSKQKINPSYIAVAGSSLDELFNILIHQEIKFQDEEGKKNIKLVEEKPDFKFEINKVNDIEYSIKAPQNMEYKLYEGKDFVYILFEDKLHKCSKKIKNTTIKLINNFKNNYATEIKFASKNITELFSIIYPQVKDSIMLENISKEDYEKYAPKELFVKLYLDLDNEQNIVSNVKFIYGTEELNPLSNKEVKVSRDVVKERIYFEMFAKSGFKLDQKNENLIMKNEGKIYEFLKNDIEKYMKEFEVLATSKFKEKEIRMPAVNNIGIKIENNLLKIDISNTDFDIKELDEILKKYKLKKKYHRLKSGEFLELEDNTSLEFIDSITSSMNIEYTQMNDGKISLPLYRSMYLENLLKSLDILSISRDEKYLNLVNKMDKENEINIEYPKANVILRDYQKVGYKWLKILEEYNLGGILADDMGLGKTLQLILVLLNYKEQNINNKPSIVVCPSSLTLNWANEIEKFAKVLKTKVIVGSAQEREKQLKNLKNIDVVITSYDLLKKDIEVYNNQNLEFKFIIADEAQYIKNNNTQNAKAIKEVNAQIKYALTGTPIENSLSELWSLFDFIMPGYLFSYKNFKDIYEIPIVKDNDSESLRKLKMLIEPFILRRVKQDVLTELPDKTITVLNNTMEDEQVELYKSFVKKAKKEAIQEIEENGVEKSHIKILALITRLRQICCHPSLFIEDFNQESGKLNQCIELVKEAVEGGHKILLFSGYTSMFNIIQEELEKNDIKYFKLTGDTKVGNRIKMVDEFNESKDVKVFLISLKAGGTGLNLVGADMVIHYDPWWNLSAENQATDRTYRIGQKKNVQVYKLITKDSIEEKIYELQQKKAKLADTMLSTSETFINKLSKEDIMALFE